MCSCGKFGGVCFAHAEEAQEKAAARVVELEAEVRRLRWFLSRRFEAHTPDHERLLDLYDRLNPAYLDHCLASPSGVPVPPPFLPGLLTPVYSGATLAASPGTAGLEERETPMATITTTRTVLRYKLEPDVNGVCEFTTPPNPVVVHAGTGTSPTVCAWVEVDLLDEDAKEGAAYETLRFALVNTGQPAPDGGEYVAFVIYDGEIRHLYRLP